MSCNLVALALACGLKRYELLLRPLSRLEA